MLCPGPRPRNAEATRGAILSAALDRFTREGYDNVGMRDIAGDVGVDAALVSRYFGSKEELFERALEACNAGKMMWMEDRATFGARVAREVIFDPQKENKLKGLLIMLKSISSPRAREIICRGADERFYGPFAELVGGEDGAVRARLAASFLMGMAISREITGGFGMTPEQCEVMADRMGRMLQDIIDS